jgi:hypothetical protein
MTSSIQISLFLVQAIASPPNSKNWELKNPFGLNYNPFCRSIFYLECTTKTCGGFNWILPRGQGTNIDI